MTLQSATINLTSASSNLQQYISDWETAVTYNGDGFFSPVFNPLDPSKVYDEWASGDTSNSSSSSVMDGALTYVPPGGFAGYVGTLTLGNSLTGSAATGFGQTDELDIVFDNTVATTDTEFTTAIYNLSNFGTFNDHAAFGTTFSGFNSYFDTYGTEINGTSGDDTIEAWSGADVIKGGDGDDIIYGKVGNDTLHGQGDDDTIYGNGGSDVLRGNTGSDTLRGGRGSDFLYGGSGSDEVRGGNGSDTVDGDGGSDTLFGGNGADTLNGGTGNDTLTGGNGTDTFVFSGTSFGNDSVTDFDAGSGSSSVDLIEVSTSAFADWAAISAASVQAGSDVVITYDASTSITLEDVTLSNLDAGDFIFV